MLALTLGFTAPALGQVAFSAEATSDYRYRGVSFSDGRPTLSLGVVYDTKSGAYVGGSTIIEAAKSGVRYLGEIEFAGYAWKPRAGPTFDLGVTNLRYSRSAGGSYDSVEVYGGARTRYLSYYVYYSPRYFFDGVSTVYGAIDGTTPSWRRLRLFGHVGALTPSSGGRERYDARIGAALGFKGGEARLAWTDRWPRPIYPAATDHAALTLGVSAFF